MAAKSNGPPASPDHPGQPGIAVDAKGGAVVDPTRNVLDLVEAAVRRQDDLREADNALNRVRIECVKEIAAIRHEHAREIRDIETKRLDAVRQVDVLAGNTNSASALAAIQTLAATTTATADTLRTAVANTATAMAATTAATVTAITERLAALEKASYTGLGKEALADPRLMEMFAELKSLRDSRSTSTGGSAATNNLIAYLIAGAGVIIAAVTLLLKS